MSQSRPSITRRQAAVSPLQQVEKSDVEILRSTCRRMEICQPKTPIVPYIVDYCSNTSKLKTASVQDVHVACRSTLYVIVQINQTTSVQDIVPLESMISCHCHRHCPPRPSLPFDAWLFAWSLERLQKTRPPISLLGQRALGCKHFVPVLKIR